MSEAPIDVFREAVIRAERADEQAEERIEELRVTLEQERKQRA